jgi:hypothetical protein
MSFSFPFCLLINANFCFYKCLSLSFFFFLSFYYILFPYRSIFLLFYLELHLPRLSKFSPRGYNCYLGKVFAKQTDSKSLSRSKLTFTLKKKNEKVIANNLSFSGLAWSNKADITSSMRSHETMFSQI